MLKPTLRALGDDRDRLRVPPGTPVYLAPSSDTKDVGNFCHRAGTMPTENHTHLPATAAARSPVNAKPNATPQSGQKLPNQPQEQHTTQLHS